jgi:hypothetical protein
VSKVLAEWIRSHPTRNSSGKRDLGNASVTAAGELGNKILPIFSKQKMAKLYPLSQPPKNVDITDIFEGNFQGDSGNRGITPFSKRSRGTVSGGPQNNLGIPVSPEDTVTEMNLAGTEHSIRILGSVTANLDFMNEETAHSRPQQLVAVVVGARSAGQVGPRVPF